MTHEIPGPEQVPEVDIASYVNVISGLVDRQAATGASDASDRRNTPESQILPDVFAAINRPEVGAALMDPGPESIRVAASEVSQRMLRIAPPNTQTLFGMHALASTAVALEMISTRHHLSNEHAWPAADRQALVDKLHNRSAHFLTCLAGNLAWGVPLEMIAQGPDPYQFIEAAEGYTGRLATIFTRDRKWLDGQLRKLATDMTYRANLEPRIAAEPVPAVDHLSQVRNNNNRLAAQLARLGLHSVPPTTVPHVRPDGVTYWSVRDTLDTKAAVVGRTASSPLHPEEFIPHVLYARKVDEPDAQVELPEVAMAYELRADPDELKGMCYVDARGELYADEYSAVPLRPVYESHGNTAGYELLRQTLLMAYFDGSVPAAVKARVAAVGPDTPPHERLQRRIRLLQNFQDANELEAAE